MNDKERLWCDNAMRRGGSFVQKFAEACFQADDNNFRIVRPALQELMQKYPKYLEVW